MDDNVFNDIKPKVEEARTLQDTSTEDLIGRTLSIGSGAFAMKADERGQWWGADDPEQAPLWFDMLGRIIMRSPGSSNYMVFDTKNVKFSMFVNGIEQFRVGDLDN